jgi:transcriptional regulator with XRE-family HTH domain
VIRFTIGDAIRRVREDKGLTQGDLAVATGLDKNTISRAERHDGKSDPKTLAVIAAKLGTPLSEFYSAIEPRDPSRHTKHSEWVLTPHEQLLVVWFRNLDARKQEAAVKLLPLFGALDATAVRHVNRGDESDAKLCPSIEAPVPQDALRVVRR